MTSRAQPGSLERAFEITAEVHGSQNDKSRVSQIAHLTRVLFSVEREDAKIAMLLHNAIACSDDWTLHRLEAEGYSAAILKAVDALTRRDGEGIPAWTRRVKEDVLARKVKLVDLAHSCDRTRLPMIGEHEENRLAEYGEAIRILSALTTDAIVAALTAFPTGWRNGRGVRKRTRQRTGLAAERDRGKAQ